MYTCADCGEMYPDNMVSREGEKKKNFICHFYELLWCSLQLQCTQEHKTENSYRDKNKKAVTHTAMKIIVSTSLL